MFFSSLGTVQFFRLFLQNLGIICLKPVSLFSGNPEIPSCFTINPVVQVDPVFDFFRALPIPGYILRKMAVGFSRIITEASQHIDPYFFLFSVFFMVFKSLQQFRDHIFSIMLYRDIPGLVIDPGADNIQFFSGDPQDFCNLRLSVDLSVAQTDSLYSSIFVAGPGSHGVGIGIIQHDCSRLRYFPDIFTEIQHFCNHSLAVHNASGTQSITYTLIHSIFQRNFNICLKSLQASDTDAVHNISGAFKSFSSVCSGKDLHRNAIGIQVPLAQGSGFLQIVLIDIGKGNFNVMKFRHRHNIRKQCPCKNKASCSDKCNFKAHDKTSRFFCFIHYNF